jgi:hypothetical protein
MIINSKVQTLEADRFNYQIVEYANIEVKQ